MCQHGHKCSVRDIGQINTRQECTTQETLSAVSKMLHPSMLCLCGVGSCLLYTSHKRFIAELVRANQLGIKLAVLCEHGGNIRTLEDVKSWYNYRLKFSPKATTGEQLYKILHTISIRHNVEFLFCNKSQTGAKIIELLEGAGYDKA